MDDRIIYLRLYVCFSITTTVTANGVMLRPTPICYVQSDNMGVFSFIMN